MYVRALEGKEKILGKEHPDTLTTVSFMAAIFEAKSQYQKALDLRRRALEGRQKVLGESYSDTKYSARKVAWLQCLVSEDETSSVEEH
jgi:hypothetical protein